MILKNEDKSPVIGTRTKELKTGFPDGRRVKVNIAQCPDYVLIDSDKDFDFLETMPEIKTKGGVLNKITMNFSSGQFHLKCNYNQYPTVLTAFTKYLFDLVFSAMEKVEESEANNENTDTSNSGDSDSGRSKGSDSNGDNGRNKKKGLKSVVSGILSGTRGSEQSKGSGSESESGDSVAEESDTDS